MNRQEKLSVSRISRNAGLAAALLFSVLVAGCDIFGEAFDERAPTVSLGQPYEGAILSGANVLVTASAQAVGTGSYISFVNISMDGSRIGEAIFDEENGRYAYRWNTYDVPDGPHRISAVAFDGSQGRGISVPILIQIDNESAIPGPMMTIMEPETLTEVSGNVRITAEPKPGEPPVSRVDLLVDGIPVLTTSTNIGGNAYAFEWDSAASGLGYHVLEVKGWSGDDAHALSAPIEVTVVGGGDGGGTEPGSLVFRGTGISGEVRGSVAVGFNDDIYVGSSNGALYAFDRTGALKWERQTNGPIRSAPVVGNNEDVFVVSEDGRLWGFTADGQDLWPVPYNSGAPLRTTPALAVDGILYFGDTFGNLHAVNSFNGQSAWSSPLKVSNGSIVQPPVISRDHTIIVADAEGRLTGYSREADLLWQSDVKGSGTCPGGAVRAPMALTEIQLVIELPTGEVRRSTEALIYAVSNDGCVYAYSAFDGSQVWHYAIVGSLVGGGTLVSGPVIDESGTIYVGTETGLFALNETADAFTPRLRYKFVADDVGQPAIDTNGVIHFMSGRRMVAINLNGTPYWDEDLATEADAPITINREGHVIVAGRNGYLFAFESGASGLAQGRWPMFGRNARHTGRLGIDQTDG